MRFFNIKTRFTIPFLICSFFFIGVYNGEEKKDPIKQIREIDYQIRDLVKYISQSRISVLQQNQTVQQVLEYPNRYCSGTDPCSAACTKGDPSIISIQEMEAMKLICSAIKIRDSIESEITRRGKLRGAISFGMNYDDAEGNQSISDKERLKVTAKFELSAGGYPNEFRANWGAQLRNEDGNLEEDVTVFRLSWDRYLYEQLESFVFAERFSDSLLSIDQRWEIGAGLEYLWKSDNYYTVDGESPLKPWVDIRNQAIYDSNNKIDQAKIDTQLSPILKDPILKKDFTKIMNALLDLSNKTKTEESIRDRTAVWEFGLGAGAFMESEEFTLTTTLVGDTDPILVNNADSLVRYSLRGSIRHRRTENTDIRAILYYKRSIEGEERNGIDDYRINGTIYLEGKVGQTFFQAKPFVRIQYFYIYDNSPPFTNNFGSCATLNCVPVIARDVHHIVQMTLNLKW